MTAGLPLVSIVTATLNRAELLEATIQSVMAQTYPNIEHVIRDGGSTDGTVDLLRRYEGRYQMRWTSKPDDGMYQAINDGLADARGEIAAYLNSDDLYFPWTIAAVVRHFRSHADADFVFGDVLAIDDTTGDQQMILNPPFDLDFIRRVGFLTQPAVFWRRTVFGDERPFDERLRYVADCDCWMRIGDRRRFSKVNEFLAIERNHPGTLRLAVGRPVWIELEAVRSRYVQLSGPDHERRVRRFRLRSKVWTRTYAGLLLIQTLIPSRLRSGPWSGLLNSGHAAPSRARLFVRAVPWIGRIPALKPLAGGEFLGPSRFWLRPGG